MMKLIKCPRCELNYMNDDEEMCSVCKRETRGEVETFELLDLCGECGENTVVAGYELCASCLKEFQRRAPIEPAEDAVVRGGVAIGIDSVATMDEIAIDIEDAPFVEDDDDDEDDDYDEAEKIVEEIIEIDDDDIDDDAAFLVDDVLDDDLVEDEA